MTFNTSLPLKTGDSIALNGVCLTVIETLALSKTVEVSEETLKKTTLKFIKPGEIVNLEPPLTPEQYISGHIVQGHVDTVGTILQIQKSVNNHKFYIKTDSKFSLFIVKHGSIAIDGISLTIFDVKKNIFSLNIIPFTFNNTNLHLKRTGSKVNIEFDIVVKFLKNHANDSKL